MADTNSHQTQNASPKAKLVRCIPANNIRNSRKRPGILTRSSLSISCPSRDLREKGEGECKKEGKREGRKVRKEREENGEGNEG